MGGGLLDKKIGFWGGRVSKTLQGEAKQESRRDAAAALGDYRTTRSQDGLWEVPTSASQANLRSQALQLPVSHGADAERDHRNNVYQFKTRCLDLLDNLQLLLATQKNGEVALCEALWQQFFVAPDPKKPYVRSQKILGKANAVLRAYPPAAYAQATQAHHYCDLLSYSVAIAAALVASYPLETRSELQNAITVAIGHCHKYLCLPDAARRVHHPQLGEAEWQHTAAVYQKLQQLRSLCENNSVTSSFVAAKATNLAHAQQQLQQISLDGLALSQPIQADGAPQSVSVKPAPSDRALIRKFLAGVAGNSFASSIELGIICELYNFKVDKYLYTSPARQMDPAEAQNLTPAQRSFRNAQYNKGFYKLLSFGADASERRQPHIALLNCDNNHFKILCVENIAYHLEDASSRDDPRLLRLGAQYAQGTVIETSEANNNCAYFSVIVGAQLKSGAMTLQQARDARHSPEYNAAAAHLRQTTWEFLQRRHREDNDLQTSIVNYMRYGA